MPDWNVLLQSLTSLPYGGEPVSQLQHALQAATLAHAAGADDDMVVACALHDIGRAPSVQAAFPNLPHEVASERFCAEHFSLRVAWLVGQHAQAKRYLVTTDPDYHAGLTPVSHRSLIRQGGPMTAAEQAEFESHRWSTDALRLRRYDDSAKDPRAESLSVDDVAVVLSRAAAGAGSRRHQV